jgi:hypothetical protein
MFSSKFVISPYLICYILLALNGICHVRGQQAVPAVINLGKSSYGISVKDNPYYSTYTGYQVSDLGDINGDGYGDIGIQANCMFYILYGSYGAISIDLSSLTPSTGFSVSGDVITFNCALQTMAAVGDINGDKFNDVLVGMASNFAYAIAPLYYIILGALSTSNINLDDLSDNTNVITINGPWVESTVAPTSFPSPSPVSPTSFPTPFPTSHPSVSTVSPTLEPSSLPTSAGLSTSTTENSETMINYLKLFPRVEENDNVPSEGRIDRKKEIEEERRNLQTLNVQAPFDASLNDKPETSSKQRFSYHEIPFPFQEVSPAEQWEKVKKEAHASVLSELNLPSEDSATKKKTVNSVEDEKSENSAASVDSSSYYYGGYYGGCYMGCCYADYYYRDYFLSASAAYSQSIYLGMSGTYSSFIPKSFVSFCLCSRFLFFIRSVLILGIGDINADGYNDIIIQGSLSDTSPVNFYVLYGSETLNSTINLDSLTAEEGFQIITSTTLFPAQSYMYHSYDHYNYSCAYNTTGDADYPDTLYINFYFENVTYNYNAVSAGGDGGDINNDGYDDMIIGSPYAYTSAGEVFILYGAPKREWNSTFYLSSLENPDSTNGYIIYGAGE